MNAHWFKVTEVLRIGPSPDDHPARYVVVACPTCRQATGLNVYLDLRAETATISCNEGHTWAEPKLYRPLLENVPNVAPDGPPIVIPPATMTEDGI
ncbi:hypothetical protein ETD86_11635 [Nonomuraea turkmeniaca]|uniref:Uncharacterized protein n=1 Tax=Nonomuraea turkmeniaca TaxID=103838 RepID=A0A5S4FP82_9ACTN|nr:hypothetical protein ETD86_11635 [Nonomuraea turkmeniaca]